MTLLRTVRLLAIVSVMASTFLPSVLAAPRDQIPSPTATTGPLGEPFGDALQIPLEPPTEVIPFTGSDQESELLPLTPDDFGTPPPPPQLGFVIQLGCRHNGPGNSDLLGFLAIQPGDSPPPPTVVLGASGPGLVRNRVTVDLQDGRGPFQLPINAFGPKTIDFADINGDGVNDVGVAVSPDGFPFMFNVQATCPPPPF